jgi:hypothetical protein
MRGKRGGGGGEREEVVYIPNCILPPSPTRPDPTGHALLRGYVGRTLRGSSALRIQVIGCSCAASSVAAAVRLVELVCLGCRAG